MTPCIGGHKKPDMRIHWIPEDEWQDFTGKNTTISRIFSRKKNGCSIGTEGMKTFPIQNKQEIEDFLEGQPVIDNRFYRMVG
jgi:hypothetical protein